MISIICPTFNSEGKISCLLESIKKQTSKDFEVIFIDNLSKDKTKDIIYQAKLNKFFFYSNKDKGIYDAINRGVKRSNFKWIWILGSDDCIFNKNTIAELIKEISIIKNSNINAIYGTTIFLSTNLPFNRKFSYDDHFSKSLCQQSIVYKKEALLNQNLFKIEYQTTADYEMNLRLIKKGIDNFKYIDKVLAIYNDRGASYCLKDKKFYKDSLGIRIDNIGSKVSKFKLLRSFFGRHGIIIFILSHSPTKSLLLIFKFIFLLFKRNKKEV